MRVSSPPVPNLCLSRGGEGNAERVGAVRLALLARLERAANCVRGYRILPIGLMLLPVIEGACPSVTINAPIDTVWDALVVPKPSNNTCSA